MDVSRSCLCQFGQLTEVSLTSWVGTTAFTLIDWNQWLVTKFKLLRKLKIFSLTIRAE